MRFDRSAALLVVDVQNDFCTGGGLAVAGSERVRGALTGHTARAGAEGATVSASRACPPATTTHFKSFGGPWPPHCVQETGGAQFHPDLRLPANAVVIT